MVNDAAGDERYWVAFSSAEGIGPIRLRRLWEHFGSLEAAWHAPAAHLAASGLDSRLVSTLMRGDRELAVAEGVLARAHRAGMSVLTLAHPSYPRRLLAIDDPPPVLYMMGTLTPEDEWSIAVVGTRRVTPYGREVTFRFTTDLVHAHLTIVSGLALGVDTHAHRAALDAGGAPSPCWVAAST